MSFEYMGKALTPHTMLMRIQGIQTQSHEKALTLITLPRSKQKRIICI